MQHTRQETAAAAAPSEVMAEEGAAEASDALNKGLLAEARACMTDGGTQEQKVQGAMKALAMVLKAQEIEGGADAVAKTLEQGRSAMAQLREQEDGKAMRQALLRRSKAVRAAKRH